MSEHNEEDKDGKDYGFWGERDEDKQNGRPVCLRLRHWEVRGEQRTRDTPVQLIHKRNRVGVRREVSAGGREVTDWKMRQTIEE